jgi:ribosomal-protein-alanine N-acetyltransferase
MRPLIDADFAELHAILTEPGVRRFLFDDVIIPEAQTREVITRSRELHSNERAGLWGVHRLDEREVLGCVGYWYFHEPPRLELLYALTERVWGCGFATEAARRMIDYGREQLAMSTILASTDAPNIASIRVLEKLGFRLTERRKANGLDTLFFALRSEPCSLLYGLSRAPLRAASPLA